MRSALLAGATGLIGKQLLDLLLHDNSYSSVITLTRKPLTINHPKLHSVIVDFDRLSATDLPKVDDVFCCLGTTMKQAGNKEAFRKVDLHYPVEVAKKIRANGGQHYLLISALGANQHATVFYNKVKGETEEAIKNIGFETFHIFRPSLLLGTRNEERSGEDAAKVFFKIFGFLVPKKYKAIDSLKVAKAMVWHAKSPAKGVFIHESAEMQNF